MYAIIEAGGKQYWVTPGETLSVDRLEASQGSTLELKALWAAETIPPGAVATFSRKGIVKVEVLDSPRGPRIIVFKKRTKKAYKKWRGHRQELTRILIKSIELN